MHLVGKSYKELKEAFIILRASFNVTKRQVVGLKKDKESLTSRVNELSKDLNKLSSKYDKDTDKLKRDNEFLKNKLIEVTTKLNEETKSTSKVTNSLESKLEACRKRSNVYRNKCNAKEARVEELEKVIKDLKSDKAKLTKEVKSLTKLNVSPIQKEVVTEVKEVIKFIKEPIPNKIRLLLSENRITKSRYDLFESLLFILRFSDITKLTLRQIVSLMEADNLKYFTTTQLLSDSPTSIKELEAKGLVQGDRSNSKKAVGWFVTKRGKEVTDLLFKKFRYNTIKKEYFNEH